MRQQEMLSRQMRNLWDVLRGAQVAPEPRDDSRAALGHLVTVQFDGSPQPESFFLCGDGEGGLFADACSVSSPVGSALLGTACGEWKTVRHGALVLSLKILAIRPARLEDLKPCLAEQ